MPYKKTITIFLMDGNSNGKQQCELSNWSGIAYKIPRNQLIDLSDDKTGVYFLFGKDDDSNDTVYIGEGDNVISRIKQHIDDKEYWSEVVFFASKDKNLNKAHVKYLENKFYTLAKEINRYRVINKTIPTLPSISEREKAEMDEFIEYSQLLINALGFKLFNPITDNNKTKDKKDYFFIESARGASAHGLLVTDGFVVLKNSRVANSVVESMSPSLVKLRTNMLENKIIDDNFIFTKDYLFTSPSLAAAIVMGRNANGRTEWTNKNKQSIKDIEESKLKDN